MSGWTGRAVIGVLVVAALAAALWWWLAAPPGRARIIAQQVASPRQAQLWNAVDDRGLPDGVNRLPVRVPGQPAPALAPSQSIAPANPVLAPGVVSAARLLSTAQDASWQYSGQARVGPVTGERLRLELGTGVVVEMLARIGKAQVNVADGDRVDVAFTIEPDVRDREQVIGLRSPRGDVLVSAVKTGAEPVVLDVALPGAATPPIRISARQGLAPASAAPPIEVVIDGVGGVVQPGTEVNVGGFTVHAVTSVARPDVGDDASPFGIELVIWRIGGVP